MFRLIYFYIKCIRRYHNCLFFITEYLSELCVKIRDNLNNKTNQQLYKAYCFYLFEAIPFIIED